MSIKVISKQDVTAWIASLAAANELIAPVETDGAWRFLPVTDPSTVNLDGPYPSKGTLREHFMPETETLFEYTVSGQSAELTTEEPSVKGRIILGATACDAGSIRYVDAVYSNVKPLDTPYFDRRERTTIIGTFCGKPSWSCFCTEVNDFLRNPIEMDVYLTDIGEKYLAEGFSPKGEEILKAAQFTDASPADIEAAESIKDAVITKLPAPANHAEECLSYDWDHPVWQKLAQKCLGCGACAFLCPTCHCFDIQECSKGKKGSRFRCWDTCQFEKFTLMGHGHNPRPTRKERTRQRVFHKYNYSQERYGMLGCVGCGRCISVCPVNIDIHRVIHKLEEKV
ncbi:MAG: 4Fe-4S dicluster domain-containing protein [Armatimonadota bacterium]